MGISLSSSWSAIILVLGLLSALVLRRLCDPLRLIPGPRLYALSSWPLAFDDLKGNSTRRIYNFHKIYGPAVRIGPSHVSMDSLEALNVIYGLGSKSQRTKFYKLFEPYGRPTMFTMSLAEDHRTRKRLLTRPYARSNVLRGPVAAEIEQHVDQFLRLLQTEHRKDCNIADYLAFYALDNTSAFVYGTRNGTSALAGTERHRALIEDTKHPQRRLLSWMAVHDASPVRCAVIGALGGVRGGILRPDETPFSRIRTWALEAFNLASKRSQEKVDESNQTTLLAELYTQSREKMVEGHHALEDMDIASECADHFLAGIETTRNLLIFLIWALSLPENEAIQLLLRNELQTLGTQSLNAQGLPVVEASDKLPYLDAVVKEALRLYAPLPSSQPRQFDTDVWIDGYHIPGGTTVSCSPYSLHRNPEVFRNPSQFAPNRWLTAHSELSEMKKWWWPFSSGGRMCTGMHVASAEIKTLIAALYTRCSTKVPDAFQRLSPAITSRFEMFWDENFEEYEEDACVIEWKLLANAETL